LQVSALRLAARQNDELGDNEEEQPRQVSSTDEFSFPAATIRGG
jgi:hypothetical protein